MRDLLLSKKFVVALLTTIGAIVAYKGWSVDPTAILPFLAPPLAYIGAQGWADSGKEKAKIGAAAAIQMHTMTMARGQLPLSRLASPPDAQKPTTNEETA